MRRTAKPVLAVVLSALVLAAATLAVCPSLHELLHHHNGTSEEGCVVCLFAQGQVNSSDVAPVVAVFVCGLAAAVLPPQIVAPRDVDYCLSPSRAPPVA